MADWDDIMSSLGASSRQADGALARNATIEQVIAAVENLDKLCADEINRLAPEDREGVMHRYHRQAYMQVLRSVEQLRDDPIDCPGVRPDRLQLMLVDRINEYLINEGKWPLINGPWRDGWRDDLRDILGWVSAQIKANATVRANTLPI